MTPDKPERAERLQILMTFHLGSRLIIQMPTRMVSATAKMPIIVIQKEVTHSLGIDRAQDGKTRFEIDLFHTKFGTLPC